MIRVGLPGATLLRARLRLQFAIVRASRRAERAWDSARNAPSAVASAVRDRLRAAVEWHEERLAARVDPAARRAFAERCDELIGLLCCAAQTGDPVAVERYAVLRDWLVRHYRPVRPALARHVALPMEVLDACRRVGAHDPVEALFVRSSLEEILHDPDSLLLMGTARQCVEAVLGDGIAPTR